MVNSVAKILKNNNL